MIQTIFMVGARGAGKTTIGGKLALALEYQFIDTDLFMQQTSQLSISDVVAREGWNGFRRRESTVLQDVACHKTVVATGGGVVLSSENCSFMREHGTVIYLHVSACILAQRLTEDPRNAQRPSLTGKPIIDEIVDVLATRDILYQQVAHHILDANNHPQQVVAQILEILSG